MEVYLRGHLIIFLNNKYKVVLKRTERFWGNGMRISPHLFNTEADIDAALKAIAIELG